MHVHLALPGLLWPAQALPDLVFDLDLPALGWLLGRGHGARSPGLAYENWVAGRFGHDTTSPPLAALRLLGDDGDPGAAHWICADPAHLAFEHGRPMLSDPAGLSLSAEECAELEAAIAPALTSVGRFSLHENGNGYVRLAAPAAMVTTPMSAAIGRGAAELLPRGIDATRWLRLANDVQIALHDLPLNTKRDAARLPVVNTLWFWGAGALPATTGTAPYEKVGVTEGNPRGTGDTLAKGCARHAGLPWHGREDIALDDTLLLIEDRLIAPTQQLDANTWREMLLAIERERLAPLVARLKRGHIKRITLTAVADQAVIDVDVKRIDALRIWRRPRALTDFLA